MITVNPLKYCQLLQSIFSAVQTFNKRRSIMQSTHVKCCNHQTSCCSLDLCLIEKAVASVSSLEAILKTVRLLSTRDKIFAAHQRIAFTLKDKHGFFNSQALLLAFEIKISMQVMSQETCQCRWRNYEDLKKDFPSNIRALIWHGKVHLKNLRFDEFLYAARLDQCAKDKERRRIFTWMDKSFKGDASSTWHFETEDGQIFYMKNASFGDYLYSPADSYNADKERKHVYNWIPGGKNYPEAKWRVNIVNGDQIIIRSAHRNDQHLYASEYKDNGSRRIVYTWIPRDQSHCNPTNHGIWNVICA